LAKIGPAARTAQDSLVRALGDADGDVRLRVILALEATGADSERVQVVLSKALKDKDPRVRSAAEQVLQKLKSAESAKK
jgi:HEAT repeat protein